MKQRIKNILHRTGFDLVRVPHPHTLEKHLQGLLRERRIDCVLDVGAMHGNYAKMLRAIGYRGWIVSVDPVPSNVVVLERKAAGDSRWRVIQGALGDAEASLSLHVSRNSDLSSFLPLNDYGRATFPEISDDIDEITVRVRRLDEAADDWLPAGVTNVFLKTDTQGYDVPVLRGATGLLPKISLVQMELPLKPLYDGMADLTEGLTELRERGYDVTGLFPVNGDASHALIEVDCVAQRRA